METLAWNESRVISVKYEESHFDIYFNAALRPYLSFGMIFVAKLLSIPYILLRYSCERISTDYSRRVHIAFQMYFFFLKLRLVITIFDTGNAGWIPNNLSLTYWFNQSMFC